MNHYRSCADALIAAAKAREEFSQERDTCSSGGHAAQEIPSESATENYRNVLQGTQVNKKVTVLMAQKFKGYCWYFQLRAILWDMP